MLLSVSRKQKRKKQPTVVSRHGRYRFQTGMITASLLRRGLNMAQAVEVARAVRDSIAGRDEITTEKLGARVEQLIEKTLGPEVAAQAKRAADADHDPVPMVETARGMFPFSKGILLRHLDTCGLALEDAMALVDRVDLWARTQGARVRLSEAQVHEEVASILRAQHGKDYARRYLLSGWMRQSRKPVIIMIGGATGTGKSTLAMELAYRLGVRWVVSTDMIRETMRTMVSPELVPGLHDHSFRGIMLGGEALSDPRERVLAGFHSQAAQVAIGVRAVITRALRENAHILIEGTHLVPPFRRYLPEPHSAHIAGFLLAVPEESEHRSRFPKRAQTQAYRAAAAYLDAFQSVRWIHDDLLQIAEDAEAVVMSNDSISRTLIGAVDFLSRDLPVQDQSSPGIASEEPSAGPDVPTLFLILDGLADEPNPALGGKTPLAAAYTPVLRRLAGSGGQGLVMTGTDSGEPPETNEGILALLADASLVPPQLGRGLFEALGQGLPIPTGAVLFRGNLATVEQDGSILDRRAGRIRAGVEDLLADLHNVPLVAGITGRVFAGHEHRVVVMLQGPGLSAAVSDTDPGDEAKVQRVRPPRALDESPEATRTAEALRELLAFASKKLSAHPLNASRIEQGLPSANAIITRGASLAVRRPNPAARANCAMVSGCSTALGVARWMGMQTASSQQMTGNLDTDLDAKFEVAGKLLEDLDLVAVHIKGTDIAAHDRRPLEKRDFIEAVDAALGRFLERHNQLSGTLRIVVSADHGTSSLTGNHLAQPVPLLLATYNSDSDDVEAFDEDSASHGALGLLKRGEIAELLGMGAALSTRASYVPQRS